MNRVLIVGNVAGGKSALARRLSQLLSLPVTHVDSIQFLPGLKIRKLTETREELFKITQQEKWILDGYGPLDLLERHFGLADRIIFIDLPVAQHYWWFFKRQLRCLWKPRAELPQGCNEATLSHTVRLTKSIWRMHTRMRPELLRIFARPDLTKKVVHIRSLKQWNQMARHGLGPSAP